jgi:ATP-dependent helicase HrpB
LRWLDPPPAAALEEAAELLRRLGAIDAGAPTEIGRRLLRFPVHPRLGRWIVAGEAMGVAKDACLLAAIASEQDLRARAWGGGGRGQAHTSGPSDLLELRDLFLDAERRRLDPGALRSLGLDARGVEAVRRARDQLHALSGEKQRLGGDEADERLLEVVLSGFTDRVARRRGPRSRELLLSRGGTASLAEESVVDEAPLLVAVAADERGDRGTGKVVVRLASAIEPEWLLDQEGIGEADELVWNHELERVERWSRITYGSVALDESRGPAAPGPETTEALLRAAVAKGMGFFLGESEWKELLARLALARSILGDELPSLEDDEALVRMLRPAAEGMRSFDELRAVDLREALLGAALGGRRHLLDEQLPPRLTLPGGRRAVIHYEVGQPPWIEARIQDFFGMTETPALLGGRIPLTLHLLAPNQRAVQVTQDLAGFWERHYPQLRRELGRRYPKHAWPEDGRTATPPPPRGRR